MSAKAQVMRAQKGGKYSKMLRLFESDSVVLLFGNLNGRRVIPLVLCLLRVDGWRTGNQLALKMVLE